MKQAVTPREVAAMILLKKIESSNTTDEFQKLKPQVQLFVDQYDTTDRFGLQSLLNTFIRASQESARSKSLKQQRKYDTHNFFTSLGQRRSSSNHDHACKVSV